MSTKVTLIGGSHAGRQADVEGSSVYLPERKPMSDLFVTEHDGVSVPALRNVCYDISEFRSCNGVVHRIGLVRDSQEDPMQLLIDSYVEKKAYIAEIRKGAIQDLARDVLRRIEQGASAFTIAEVMRACLGLRG